MAGFWKLSKEFIVAKLFVQVSVCWSVAAKLFSVKVCEFPDTSVPNSAEFLKSK